MRWKIKKRVQNSILNLPSSVSYSVYYWIQRYFDNLRRINPVSRLIGGINIWKWIIIHGHEPNGKIFFEVGTGRASIVHLAFWLMGAEKIITTDPNPYI